MKRVRRLRHVLHEVHEQHIIAGLCRHCASRPLIHDLAKMAGCCAFSCGNTACVVHVIRQGLALMFTAHVHFAHGAVLPLPAAFIGMTDGP